MAVLVMGGMTVSPLVSAGALDTHRLLVPLLLYLATAGLAFWGIVTAAE